ncbi:hypothetical protein SM139_3634, partial [Stenotrophomonas maltophilia]
SPAPLRPGHVAAAGRYAAARLCRGGADGSARCDRCDRAAPAGGGRRPGDGHLPRRLHCGAQRVHAGTQASVVAVAESG